jgi:hypothetical protein
MLIINTISRPVFFTRDNQTCETNNTGERITEQEFTTLRSEGEVICIDDATGNRYVYTPGETTVYVIAPESTVVVEQNTQLPVTDTGLVPTVVEAGSKNATT